MKKLAMLAAVLGLVAAGLVSAQGSKTPSIKDIMSKLGKGTTSLCPTLGKELKDDEPAWDEIQKQTKEFVSLVEALGKNDPPMGTKDSWTRLTSQYLANAKDLDTAAQKKDRSAAAAAHKKITGSCMACHKAHKQ